MGVEVIVGVNVKVGVLVFVGVCVSVEVDVGVLVEVFVGVGDGRNALQDWRKPETPIIINTIGIHLK